MIYLVAIVALPVACRLQLAYSRRRRARQAQGKTNAWATKPPS